MASSNSSTTDKMTASTTNLGRPPVEQPDFSAKAKYADFNTIDYTRGPRKHLAAILENMLWGERTIEISTFPLLSTSSEEIDSSALLLLGMKVLAEQGYVCKNATIEESDEGRDFVEFEIDWEATAKAIEGTTTNGTTVPVCEAPDAAIVTTITAAVEKVIATIHAFGNTSRRAQDAIVDAMRTFTRYSNSKFTDEKVDHCLQGMIQALTLPGIQRDSSMDDVMAHYRELVSLTDEADKAVAEGPTVDAVSKRRHRSL